MPSDFDEEALLRLAIQLQDAMNQYPEWITEDAHLREAASRLESDRIMTPEVVGEVLSPLIESRISPKERARLIQCVAAGDVDEVSTVIKRILDDWVSENDDPRPPGV